MSERSRVPQSEREAFAAGVRRGFLDRKERRTVEIPAGLRAAYTDGLRLGVQKRAEVAQEMGRRWPEAQDDGDARLLAAIAEHPQVSTDLRERFAGMLKRARHTGAELTAEQRLFARKTAARLGVVLR